MVDYNGRGNYQSNPWMEEAAKRKKRIRRRHILDMMLNDLLFLLLGAFLTLVTLSYFPMA